MTNAVFHIPEQNLPKFNREIEKLNRRAAKLGVGTITIMVIGFEMKEVRKGLEIKVYEVYVQGEEVKVNGWNFIAKIDHANEAGNIVRVVPGEELPTMYQDTDSGCDHCHVSRFRRDTFIVYNSETDEHKQVGSTCLADFLGHGSPEKYAKYAELLSYAVEHGYAMEDYDPISMEHKDLRYIDLEIFLSHTVYAIEKYGWISRTTAYKDNKIATAIMALDQMYPPASPEPIVIPTNEQVELSRKAMEWAQSLEDRTDLNDYLHNIYVLAASGVIEFRNIGYAASIVNAYKKEVEKLSYVDAHLQMLASFADTDYEGVVKSRQEFEVEILETRGMPSDWGFSYLHWTRSLDGNLIVFFFTNQLETGKLYKLKGTPQRHEVRDGAKQTTINRVKVN